MKKNINILWIVIPLLVIGIFVFLHLSIKQNTELIISLNSSQLNIINKKNTYSSNNPKIESNTEDIMTANNSVIKLTEVIKDNIDELERLREKINQHSKTFGVINKMVLNHQEVLELHEKYWKTIINQ